MIIEPIIHWTKKGLKQTTYDDNWNENIMYSTKRISEHEHAE